MLQDVTGVTVNKVVSESTKRRRDVQLGGATEAMAFLIDVRRGRIRFMYCPF